MSTYPNETTHQHPGADEESHHLSDHARDLLSATSGLADEKVTRARERLSAALERGKESYARLQEKARHGVERADETVRNHPYEALAIAFGLGAVIGCLLTRRH